MITQQERLRERRRAFHRGMAHARRAPTDRASALASARRALSFLPLIDRHALAVESTLSNIDEMVTVATMAMGTITVITRRLPSLERAVLIERIFVEARRMLEEGAADDRATRH